MNLNCDEFEEFKVTLEVAVSFNLREVKAALAFAEFIALSLSIYFDEAGKPMFLYMDSDPTFEMVFIISTISESLSQSSVGSVQGAANTSTISNVSNIRDKVHFTSNYTKPSTSNTKPSTSSTKPSTSGKKFIGKISSNSGPIDSFLFPTDSKEENWKISSKVPTSLPSHSTSEVKVKPKLNSLMNDTSITLLDTNSKATTSKPPDDIDELIKEIDDGSTIEPLTKKAKLLFFNKTPSVKTQSKSQALVDEILAEDSEDD
ncbi:hypothetical protein EB796_003745 [Bugula neritina]|uniref:RAD9A n=1 Tax=Bugula neritina TaxID=10212 RepID=A0A7J7KI79_BUGNE|nr:hypothetical protein EB796_003745 [Bugula neritina]